ncbi:MAG TPA: HD domain-containing phosphohydrolase [Phycisphaerae bacterium]|nr:HD domain-containing phosphohydrolase [Phycisphaerae bacterium]
MNILILDDDAVCLEALNQALIRAGHDVQVARNGHEALELLREGTIRLVISDWIMPGMDGLELCRRIRSEEFPAYVYFILLTSRDGVDRIVEGLSAGADEFLTKPFHPAELSVRLRAAERILSLETRDVAIFALARLAESRDPETGEHLDRVRMYSRIIAKHFAQRADGGEPVDAEFVRLIYLTSPLHDIGKVGIPDSVLLKPGRLSNREFEIMKTHVTIGAETLGAARRQFPNVRFLQMAQEIALSHHERFDGSGYPSGLRGKRIPLSGRIVALADVYDALTSKRVYKQAFAHEVARGIVLEGSGQHFDPDVVEAFVENEDAFIAVRERFAEHELVPA